MLTPEHVLHDLRCDQKGRVVGGIGAIADWWPIKVSCRGRLMVHHRV